MYQPKTRTLLIEPVWNRNASWREVEKRIAEAFNRTSLESKLFMPNRIRQNNCLLIEPVWNRNLFSVVLLRSTRLF